MLGWGTVQWRRLPEILSVLSTLLSEHNGTRAEDNAAATDSSAGQKRSTSPELPVPQPLQYSNSSSNSNINWMPKDDGKSKIKDFFTAYRSGNLEAVKWHLANNANVMEPIWQYVRKDVLACSSHE
ncbi:hypothetical protein BGZ65_009411 [Modicella reniformis]|uniref:Uncharacterized protein n=1 Tax=Modicella reniformis TaxID=1440133 RepID=A0A9P6M7C8_9FUNG|nr:hypothetical protein BGZ65_009411 [Modicella reniformis]